jgi:hypothetical protein
MVSNEHTVVITYDGATDCDDDDSARWSRDGEDQGLVAGVTCSLGGGQTTCAGTIALVVAVILLAGRRRRDGRATALDREA